MCSRADTSYPLCLTRIPYSNLIALFNSISISNFYKFSFRSVFLLQLFFQFDSFYICFVFFRAISLSHLHFVSERFLNWNSISFKQWNQRCLQLATLIALATLLVSWKQYILDLCAFVSWKKKIKLFFLPFPMCLNHILNHLYLLFSLLFCLFANFLLSQIQIDFCDKTLMFMSIKTW